MNTIIEKVRAEVERRKKELEKDKTIHPANQAGRIKELGLILSRLSDLEKEEKPMELDFEQELYKHFGQVKDFTLGMQIAKHFYELCCCRTAEKYDEIEYKRQRADVCEGFDELTPEEKMNHPLYLEGFEVGRKVGLVLAEKTTIPAEGLEEEIQKYMSERWEFGCINPTTPVYLYDFTTDELKECARHFTQWQKEQMMDEWLKDRDGCFWDGVEEGKKAMREQMMKEAVEGDYTLEDGRIEIEGEPLPCLNPILNLPYPKFKPGQKVKIIIVKEDDK